MGAWGTGPFENDGAGDALAILRDLVAPELAEQIREWLALPEDYLEVDEGQTVVALAALLAAALGHPVDDDADAQRLVAGGGLPTDADTRRLTVAALGRIAGQDSEWAELWGEAGELETVLEINAQLAGALATPQALQP